MSFVTKQIRWNKFPIKYTFYKPDKPKLTSLLSLYCTEASKKPGYNWKSGFLTETI